MLCVDVVFFVVSVGAFLTVVAPLDVVSCFVSDNNSVEIYPSSPATLTLLQPDASENTSTAVFSDKLVTISLLVLGSFLKFTVVELIYCVFITVFVTGTSVC